MITGKYPSLRLRRSRKYEWSRRLIQENNLTPGDFEGVINTHIDSLQSDPKPLTTGQRASSMMSRFSWGKRSQGGKRAKRMTRGGKRSRKSKKSRKSRKSKKIHR